MSDTYTCQMCGETVEIVKQPTHITEECKPAPVIEATTNEVPIGTRAVMFKFATTTGSCSVTFDRYSTEYALFSSLPQMTSNAINSVIASGRQIIDFTTYFVR